MIKGKCKCIVCKKEDDYYINTDVNQEEMDDYMLLKKNEDGTYLAEIKVKCKYCGAIYKNTDNIEFKPDSVLDAPFIPSLF